MSERTWLIVGRSLVGVGIAGFCVCTVLLVAYKTPHNMEPGIRMACNLDVLLSLVKLAGMMGASAFVTWLGSLSLRQAKYGQLPS